MLRPDGQPTDAVAVTEGCYVEMAYRVHQTIPSCRIGFMLRAWDGTTVFESYDTDDTRNDPRREPGEYVMRCRIPGDLLNVGEHLIGINADIPNSRFLVQEEAALKIEVTSVGVVGSNLDVPRAGTMRPKLEWTSDDAPASAPEEAGAPTHRVS